MKNKAKSTSPLLTIMKSFWSYFGVFEFLAAVVSILTAFAQGQFPFAWKVFLGCNFCAILLSPVYAYFKNKDELSQAWKELPNTISGSVALFVIFFGMIVVAEVGPTATRFMIELVDTPTKVSSAPSPSPTLGPTQLPSRPSPVPSPSPSPVPSPSPSPVPPPTLTLCAEQAVPVPFSGGELTLNSFNGYDNFDIMQLSILDQELGKIAFGADCPASRMVSTESSNNSGADRSIHFSIPETNVQAKRIWLVLSADATHKPQQQQVIGEVVARFKNGTSEAFALTLGSNIADWTFAGDSVKVFDPTQVKRIWAGLERKERHLNSRAAQLFAIPLTIKTRDPLAAITIEDQSQKTLGTADPGLNIIAAVVIRDRPRTTEAQNHHDEFGLPQGSTSLPVCFYLNSEQTFTNLLTFDNAYRFHTDCQPQKIDELAANVDFSFSVVKRTYPDEPITFTPASVNPAMTRLYLVMSAHNVCRTPIASASAGELTIHFADGQKPLSFLLDMGITIREGRTNFADCATKGLNIYTIGNGLRDQDKGLRVYPGLPVSADPQANNIRPPKDIELWLDRFMIDLPPRPIQSVEIKQTFEYNREKVRPEDTPYINLYAATFVQEAQP